jgi:hypothetical protein
MIEQFNQGLRQQMVGQHGETAHIRRPNCCIDRFRVTAPDMAGENAPSRVVAHKCVEEIAGGPPQLVDFSDPRKGSDD